MDSDEHEQRVQEIDTMMGFSEYTAQKKRDGWLLNLREVKTPSPSDENELLSGLELYFVCGDGGSFKTTVTHRPYFYASPEDGRDGAYVFLQKNYEKMGATIENATKTDLAMHNHLGGKRHTLFRLSFQDTEKMRRAVRDIKSHVTGEGTAKMLKGIYEHDVEYSMRVLIDLGLRVGLWYTVSRHQEALRIRAVAGNRPRSEPRTFAFDIETTKKPLRFPDAETDSITMISAMFDGVGYLITNREWISEDIPDFEYTPKPEYPGHFTVINRKTECDVLKEFFALVQESRPTIFVTFNGDFFDWPFIRRRSREHGLDLFASIGIAAKNEVYTASYASHVDVFRWVQRDSYLPMGSQGLKSVTAAKLGFSPLEIDHEKAMEYAQTQPFYLASYSVSDAVSTFYLYTEQVSSFLFSMCNIIPYSLDNVLRKGTGTLCEGLLMAEAYQNNILIPNKAHAEEEKFHGKTRIASETYVGGYVETLEVGLFREDIPVAFTPSAPYGERLVEELDSLCAYFFRQRGIQQDDVENYGEAKNHFARLLEEAMRGKRTETPQIFHYDIAAMYPNIILTNRLQPFAITNPQKCAACDFNTPDGNCKRKMKWTRKLELDGGKDGNNTTLSGDIEEVPGKKRPAEKRPAENIKNTGRKKKMTVEEEDTVCMREHPFYINTVRDFRDKRYVYKGLQKEWAAKKDSDPNGRRMVALYNSLQLAHKCILNSFYGYVMRQGARWYSREMAGIVCKTGSEIIKMAREIFEKIGRPVELDTDGIWTLVPSSFPESIDFVLRGGKEVSLPYLVTLLNHQIERSFTNTQYHRENEIVSENSLYFEIDGPYRAMFVPASTEEAKMLKKRYLVFDKRGRLVETKGFEIKRRSELKIVKEIQLELFQLYLSGTTLAECYRILGEAARRWLKILLEHGGALDDQDLAELLIENKNMSKAPKQYGKNKSCALTTVKRLAEIFPEIDTEKAGILCRFLVSGTPANTTVSKRAIPADVFSLEPETKLRFLLRWTEKRLSQDSTLRDVLDWSYYIDRVSTLLLKLVAIPANIQGVQNPIPEIKLPSWVSLATEKKIKITAFISTKKKETQKTHTDCEAPQKRSTLLQITHIRENTYRIWTAAEKEIEVAECAVDPVFYTQVCEKENTGTQWTLPSGKEKKTLYKTKKTGAKQNTETKHFYPDTQSLHRTVQEYFQHSVSAESLALEIPRCLLFYYQSKNRLFCVVFEETEATVFVQDKNKNLPLAGKIAACEYTATYHTAQETLNRKINDRLKKIAKTPLVILETNISRKAISASIPFTTKTPMLLSPHEKQFPGLSWQQLLLARAGDSYRNTSSHVEAAFLLSEQFQIPVGNIGRDRLQSAFMFSLEKMLVDKKVLVPDTKYTAEDSPLQSLGGFYDTVCVELRLSFLCFNAIRKHSLIEKEASLGECSSAHLLSVLGSFLKKHSGQSQTPAECFSVLLPLLLECPLLDTPVKQHIVLLIKTQFALIAAELGEVNAQLFYAAEDTLLIATGKKTTEGAQSFLAYLLNHLLKKEVFGDVAATPTKIYKKVLWLDKGNFIKKTEERTETSWSLAEYLPAVARKYFKEIARDLVENHAEITRETKENNSGKPSSSIQKYLAVVSHLKTLEAENNEAAILPKRIGCFPETQSVSFEFVKTVGAVLGLFGEQSDFFFRLNKIAFSLLNKSVFADDAASTNPFQSLVLGSMRCLHCGRPNSIDLCQDPRIVVMHERNSPSPLPCRHCENELSMQKLESDLVDYAEHLLVEYNTQDVLCASCSTAKHTSLGRTCLCGNKTFTQALQKEKLGRQAETLKQLAVFFRMDILGEKVKLL
ncbi:MAG: DNA polymerase epsilon catalytic subunit A [Amphiamblys sp. WSBS2006]|nr:MAG: DNA polymerase epsilon catalytic subunit A [Amphiamblys sp. WSBS2006]